MRWVDRALGGLWVLGALGAFTACGDDDPGEQPDGGSGGRSTGGSAQTGGRATGGSTGGKGSGATSNGGTGNTGGQTPDAGGETDGGMDSSAGGDGSAGDPDSGPPDAAVDSGSTNDAGDGGSAALCPQSGSWPVGTYTLKANVGNSMLRERGFPSPRYQENVCTHVRKSLTLTITKPVHYDCLFVEVDEPGPQGPVKLDCVDIAEHDTYVSIRDALTCSGIGTPFRCNYLDIDRRTGAIIAMKYTESRTNPTGDVHDFALQATGWPRCTATEASPPTVPEPPGAGICSATVNQIPLGCEHTYAMDATDPAPPCAGQSATCSCQAIPGGTLTACCPPS